MAELSALEEAVAEATLAYRVAVGLEKEFRGKLRVAEEDVMNASRRLDDARHVLEEAIVENHEVPYVDPVTDIDRVKFETRYAASVEKLRTIREERDRRRKEDAEKAEKDAQDLISKMDAQVVPADVIRTNRCF